MFAMQVKLNKVEKQFTDSLCSYSARTDTHRRVHMNTGILYPLFYVKNVV